MRKAAGRIVLPLVLSLGGVLLLHVGRPPWGDDPHLVRQAALKQGRPCVIVLNADRSIL